MWGILNDQSNASHKKKYFNKINIQEGNTGLSRMAEFQPQVQIQCNAHLQQPFSWFSKVNLSQFIMNQIARRYFIYISFSMKYKRSKSTKHIFFRTLSEVIK